MYTSKGRIALVHSTEARSYKAIVTSTPDRNDEVDSRLGRLLTDQDPPVPVVSQGRWNPQLLWMLWKKKKETFLAPAGNWTIGHPTRRLVTTLSWFPNEHIQEFTGLSKNKYITVRHVNISLYRLGEKGTTIPLQAPRVQAGWGSQVSRQSAHEGGKFVSPRHRPPLPLRSVPGTHFC